jgi:hypothetical protein
MAAKNSPYRNMVETSVFVHWLRTGFMADVDPMIDLIERKYNHIHDERGRFASSFGGAMSGGQSIARMTDRTGSTDRSANPAPTQAVHPLIADIMKRAQSMASNAMQQARSLTLASHPPVRALLDQIAKGEGVDNAGARLHGYASSYDVPFNYGRYAQQTKPLTQMTLGEIDNLQTRILAHPANRLGASPMGKYQIVQRTLRELKGKLGLSDNMIFNQTLQDMLGANLLEKRGVKDYIDGKISEIEFQRRMASEWASIADPRTGRPRRSGQHLGTTTSQISPLIQSLRPK